VARLAEGFCQGVRGILVVVDYEDAPARFAVAGRTWRGVGGVHRPPAVAARQGNDELATRPRAGAVRLDPAAMQLDQTAHDCQP
jgi:hypothetical protein